MNIVSTNYSVFHLFAKTPQYGFGERGYTHYSVQKTLRVRATNAGSKISFLVYQWPPYKTQNLVYEWVDFL